MSILINVEDLLNKHKIESNRRLGDYLQELQLSEGRATGIPTIQDELRKNRYSGARSASNSSLKKVKRCSLTYKK